MIHEVSGDILLSRAQVVAHGVAPNDHFANGLALALRERWPAMVKDFRHWVHGEHPKPGGLWAWPTPDGRRVVSLLTQSGEIGHGGTPGPAQLEYVRHALHELRLFCIAEKVTSLALPKLATGVGRLNWNDVLPLIQSQLGDLSTQVIVYSTYHPGQTATEGLATTTDRVAAHA